MHRFIVKPSQIENNYFVIKDEKIIRYVRNVLRLKSGIEVEIADGNGKLYIAELKKVMREGIEGKIIRENIQNEESSSLKLTLAQGLPRAGKLDEIIRMNTEIGVSEFVLFESEFSMVRINNFKENKIERLDRLATEASKQSERLNIPKIHLPIKFEELAEKEFDLKILLHSRNVEGSVDIHVLREEIKKNNLNSVMVCVGPEGGFSPKEVEFAIKNGFKVGYLNLPILRTETAGVAVSGVLLS